MTSLLAFALTALLFQPLPGTVLRFGLLSALGEADVQQLRDLSAPRGDGEQWLMWSSVRGLVNSDSRVPVEVTILLSPRVVTPALRRGSAFVASSLARLDEARAWTPTNHGPHHWAQVAVPSRDFDDVRGTRDVNFPFTTDSVIADDELVRVVEFLRTAPVFEQERAYPIVEISQLPALDNRTRIQLKLANTGAVETYELQPLGDGYSVVYHGVEPQP